VRLATLRRVHGRWLFAAATVKVEARGGECGSDARGFDGVVESSLADPERAARLFQR